MYVCCYILCASISVCTICEQLCVQAPKPEFKELHVVVWVESASENDGQFRGDHMQSTMKEQP